MVAADIIATTGQLTRTSFEFDEPACTRIEHSIARATTTATKIAGYIARAAESGSSVGSSSAKGETRLDSRDNST